MTKMPYTRLSLMRSVSVSRGSTDMIPAKWYMAVAVLSVVVTAGCSGKDGGGTVLPPASSLRVRVMSYDNAGLVQVAPGATVVLGDSTGAMVSSRVTDANGTATFSNPPQNATVTSAWTNDGGFYSLHSFYDVNVAAITILVYKYASPVKLGTVNFNIACNGAWGADMYASSRWRTWKICSSGTATFSVDLYTSDQQTDGKFSFLAVGTDSAGNPISFGYLLDQDFPNSVPVDIALDHPQTPFPEQVTTYASIPGNFGGRAWTAMNARRTEGQIIYNGTSSTLSSSLTHSFSVTAPTDFATSFDLYGYLYLDTNNTGTIDKYFGFWQRMSAPAIQTLDLSVFPQEPSGVGVTNSATDRPTISFNISTLPVILVSGPTTTPSYSYTIEAPSTRRSIIFPELPVSLAAFRPGAWAGKFYLAAENDQKDYCSSYSDCLTKTDTWGGTVGEPTYLSKRTGRNYVVDGETATLAKPGATGSIPATQSPLQPKIWLMR